MKQSALSINVDDPSEAPCPQLFDLLRSPQNENAFTKLRLYDTQNESDTTIAALKEVFDLQKTFTDKIIIYINLRLTCTMHRRSIIKLKSFFHNA